MLCYVLYSMRSKTNHMGRVRYQVSSANALNFSVECSKLADQIKQYALQGESSMFVD